MGRRQATGKGGGRGAAYKRGGDSTYQRKSTLDASVLGLGGGAVPSLGGGAMNLASLLGGGGLQTQMNPLAGALGGPSMGFIGASGVPNELAGLCALLGNQQSHNVTLTNLQVVELQRAVAAQKLATEKQAAALVQAKIDEKVAEELKKVALGALHAPSEKEGGKDGDGDLSSSRSGSSQGARRRAKHAERACWTMCTPGQPTNPQCDSDEFASRRATEGGGCPEVGDRKASGCAGTGED